MSAMFPQWNRLQGENRRTVQIFPVRSRMVRAEMCGGSKFVADFHRSVNAFATQKIFPRLPARSRRRNVRLASFDPDRRTRREQENEMTQRNNQQDVRSGNNQS